MMTRRPAAGRRHPSVQLLLDRNPGRDAEAIIRDRARALVQYATGLGWQGPPFDMKDLANIHGVKVVRDTSGAVTDAVLAPDLHAMEFTIRVAVGLAEERERYSIPHEVVHTFFPDCAVMVRHRGGDGPDDKELEALCDIGASELLLPFGPFMRDLDALGGVSFDSLAVLRERYQASWEATGNRMVFMSADAVAMVVLSHRLKPVESGSAWTPGMGPEPKLRIDYSVRSRGWPSQGAFVPPHKSIPDTSCLYDLLQDFVIAGSPDQVASATEDWSALRLGVVDVRAMRLSAVGAPPKVLAMLTAR